MKNSLVVDPNRIILLIEGEKEHFKFTAVLSFDDALSMSKGLADAVDQGRKMIVTSAPPIPGSLKVH